MLDVPYHAQEEDLYCGPASVRMVIEYISGKLTSLHALAMEMGTGKGTHHSRMGIPFWSLGYEYVSEDRITLDELKELNSQGYASIIAIWFDTNHKNGYYVVVIGYDQNGAYVNDPWGTFRSQPVSRRTGKDAVISYTPLVDLWTESAQWVLRIPYLWYAAPPPSSTYSIPISVAGIREDYGTILTVDGIESGPIKSAEVRSLDFKVGTSHEISVDPYASSTTGTRYYCSSNSQSASSSGEYSFTYGMQYHLDASSPYGDTSGSS